MNDRALAPIPVRRPVPRPRPVPDAAPVPSPAYVAPAPELDFDGAFDTRLFHELAAFDAVTARHSALKLPSLAEVRGYEPATLYALAEVAHHYLVSGGTRIGLVLFEGIAAIAPDEAYFQLGLGFALAESGREEAAARAYERAIGLDPGDGRAECNLAELLLARGDRAGARRHFARARDKARARREEELARKASAILSRIR